MNGWQRFFLLLLCSVGVLICWPQYETAGLTFVSLAIVLWTCIIILLSILSNIFGIYKFELLNRLVSFVFLAVLLASYIYYFPLEKNQTPWSRFQNNHPPTVADMQQGVHRLTDFFNRLRGQAHDNADYVNEKLEGAADKLKQTEKSVKKQKKALDIIFGDAEN